MLASTACAAKVKPATPSPSVEAAPSPEAVEPQRLQQELERGRSELEQAQAENAKLRDQLRAARQEAASAEEQREALRREMDRALEEVLASKASFRGFHNRALAISRIAEVRVQLQSADKRDETEVAERLDRAAALLARADRALEEGNYGGASYLADRAGEFVGHARAVAEVTAQMAGKASGLIPIVPQRRLEVVVSANLRQGPDTARRRIGGAPPGTNLMALARLGEWYEVETGEGSTAWIHRMCVR